MQNETRTVITRAGLVQRVDPKGHGKTIGAVIREAFGWYVTDGGNARRGPFRKRSDAAATLA